MSDDIYIADGNTLLIAERLKETRDMIRAFKNKEKRLMEDLELAMGDARLLSTEDGEQILTWDYSKPALKFNLKSFKESLPIVYEQFLYEEKPIRRLCFVKK